MNPYSLIVFLFVVFPLYCQTEKLEVDTDTLPIAPTHSVRKAAIFSGIVPGSGQIYNHIAMPKGQKKAYWKVPLIYAGLGIMGHFALRNNTEQSRLKQEYINRQTNNIIGQEYASYDNTALIMLYQQRLNRRDLFFIGLGLVYVVQIVDAAVEAHFVRFEVSQDLSLMIRPKFFLPQINNTTPVGVSFQFCFNE